MATTNECQIVLTQLIITWFANADPAFNVPINSANIREYNTTPDEQSTSPNWCIVAAVNTISDAFVAAGDRFPTRLVILLYAKLSKGADAEASRKAAERWLNDAEEMLMMNLADVGDSDYWYEITTPVPPRRDGDMMFWRNYRTSQIVVDIDKK